MRLAPVSNTRCPGRRLGQSPVTTASTVTESCMMNVATVRRRGVRRGGERLEEQVQAHRQAEHDDFGRARELVEVGGLDCAGRGQPFDRQAAAVCDDLPRLPKSVKSCRMTGFRCGRPHVRLALWNLKLRGCTSSERESP